MSTDVRRVEFDSTLDEIVDANMRLVQSTTAYQRQRRLYQWIFAVGFPAGVGIAMIRANNVPSLAGLAIESLAALAGGVALGVLYGRYHDWYVRRGARRLVKEMYGGSGVVHCEYELRNDALWCRSIHAEMSLPWSRMTRVADVPGSIEVWFDPGLAIVRDRAFQSAEDRRAFLDAIRQHAH
jgi:hypothetical protein